MESQQEQGIRWTPGLSGLMMLAHICSATMFSQKSILKHPVAHCIPTSGWLPVLCQELLFKNTSHVFLCSLMSGHKMEISFYQRWRGCQKTNGCCCGGVLEEGGTGPCGVWIDWVLSIAIRLSEYSATVTAIKKKKKSLIAELCCPPPGYAQGWVGRYFSQPRSLSSALV